MCAISLHHSGRAGQGVCRADQGGRAIQGIGVPFKAAGRHIQKIDLFHSAPSSAVGNWTATAPHRKRRGISDGYRRLGWARRAPRGRLAQASSITSIIPPIPNIQFTHTESMYLILIQHDCMQWSPDSAAPGRQHGMHVNTCNCCDMLESL